jgi:radical SAM superfamily enzyme YgiQ (UPF0313 family)
MKSILLVQAETDRSSRYSRFDFDPTVFDHSQGLASLAAFTPVSIATIGALTPNEWSLDMWDESHSGAISDSSKLPKERYDIVGISVLFSMAAGRAIEIARLFKSRGAYVVMGGPGVSTEPELFRDHCDTVFVNEAEKTWPQFLSDWSAGSAKKEYIQIDKPDMTQSPPPRWEPISANLQKGYYRGVVQTTRGCPFDCEFCDVIYLFGRKQRHKPIETVLEEIKNLERLGCRGIMFADDEFVGDPKYAKDLLRAVIQLNNSFKNPLAYRTQLTLNFAKDDELLGLAADAHLTEMLIGIESVNEESLRETHKFQNIRPNVMGDLHKINSYGHCIIGSLIVGFDHDDIGTFDRLFSFVQAACIPFPRVFPLNAMHGTKLWTRLREEGRLVKIRKEARGEKEHYHHTTGHGSLNIMPKGMTRVQLMEGYRDLVIRMFEWTAIRDRLCGWVDMVTRPPTVNEKLLTEKEAELFVTAADKSLGLNDEGRKILREIMGHALSTKPYLINKLIRILNRNVGYKKEFTMGIPNLETQISAEKNGEVTIHIDNTAVAVSSSLAKAIPKAFPMVYRRLYLNLEDKDSIPAAATEVFVDFIVRFGAAFKELEEYHQEMLRETCDRTCAKMNNVPPENFTPITTSDVSVPESEIKRNRLADSVLKNVRDELARISRVRAESARA